MCESGGKFIPSTKKDFTLISAVRVAHLKKQYPGTEVPAVKDISFTIEQGEVWGLLGPNGAGKTTTISILCGLLKQTDGEVEIFGHTYSHHTQAIKRMIGLIPQEIALFPLLTANENLTYIGNMYGLRGQSLRNLIKDYLERFGLTHHADQRLQTYSGGMKRRINLIAGIMHQPKIVFLDEPTVGVDVQSRNMIHTFLKELNQQGTTIIYTSHLMEEAESLCTDLAIIDHGKIIAIGEPEAMIRDSNARNLEDLFLNLTGRTLRD